MKNTYPIKRTTRSADGTGFQADLNIDYKTLVEICGEPDQSNDGDGKVRVEWKIEVANEVVTIYDWKETKPVEEVREWHMGAKRKELAIILKGYIERTAEIKK